MSIFNLILVLGVFIYFSMYGYCRGTIHMNKSKELHILVPLETHRTLFTKVAEEDFSVSQLIRKWIRLYLKGELQ